MTTDAHRIVADPSVDGPAPLPEVPRAGLVLASIGSGDPEAFGAQLLEFSRRWRDEGRRVYLCDACFEEPILHAAAGVGNGEGLSDSLLYGTSLGRISQRLDKDLALAPAGTVVGDPDGVRAHGRWATILSGFEEAGALLVVAAPAGSEGALLVEGASAHLLFGDEPPLPEVDSPAEPTVTRDEDAERDAEHRDDPVAHEEGAVDGSGPELDVEVVAAAGDERAAEPSPMEFDAEAGEVIREASKGGVTPLTIVLLILLAAVFGLSYFGIVEIPGITPADAEVASDLLLNS